MITSAGLILAGTFAVLMALPVESLFQVGFTIALGILVDPFAVRVFLVPGHRGPAGRAQLVAAPSGRTAGPERRSEVAFADRRHKSLYLPARLRRDFGGARVWEAPPGGRREAR